MVRVETIVVYIELVENHVTGRTHLERKVDGDVGETEMAGDVNRCASHVVTLCDQGQNLSLAKLCALLKNLSNLCNLSGINDREQSTAVEELILRKRDTFRDLLN